LLADERGRCRRAHDKDALLFARDLLDRQPCRGGGAIGKQVHARVIHPFSRQCACDIGLVLIVSLHHFDRASKHRPAEVGDGHFSGQSATGSTNMAIGAGNVA
jgi:hypothetical protein